MCTTFNQSFFRPAMAGAALHSCIRMASPVAPCISSKVLSVKRADLQIHPTQCVSQKDASRKDLFMCRSNEPTICAQHA